VIDLGLLDAVRRKRESINESGVIVGNTSGKAGSTPSAFGFIYKDGVMHKAAPRRRIWCTVKIPWLSALPTIPIAYAHGPQLVSWDNAEWHRDCSSQGQPSIIGMICAGRGARQSG